MKHGKCFRVVLLTLAVADDFTPFEPVPIKYFVESLGAYILVLHFLF